MRIGIITVHRAYNYGSVLQCYALQEYLKQQGHDVCVIDYRQRWTEAVYSPFSLYYIGHFLKKKDIHAIIDYWRKRKERKKRLNETRPLFERFMKKFNLTSPCIKKVPNGFDVYLIGSDQLWTHQCVGGEDKFYLGYFSHPKGSMVVGYSLSSSITSLYKFGANKLNRIIANFDKLSVRENGVSELIEKLTNKRLPITVDPTLLVDANLWESMINDSWKKENYIAIYQARPIPGNPNYLEKKAVELSKKMHCNIIDLSTMRYSVEDFISIIKYARCVITTSYHAVVFSVLMETPCYAVKLNDGLDVRYIDLLTELGLDSELVEMDFEPNPIEPNFNGLKHRIEKYRQASVRYLSFESYNR